MMIGLLDRLKKQRAAMEAETAADYGALLAQSLGKELPDAELAALNECAAEMDLTPSDVERDRAVLAEMMNARRRAADFERERPALQAASEAANKALEDAERALKDARERRSLAHRRAAGVGGWSPAYGGLRRENPRIAGILDSLPDDGDGAKRRGK